MIKNHQFATAPLINLIFNLQDVMYLFYIEFLNSFYFFKSVIIGASFILDKVNIPYFFLET